MSYACSGRLRVIGGRAAAGDLDGDGRDEIDWGTAPPLTVSSDTI